MVSSTEMEGENALLDVVKKYSKYYRVKSRTLSMGRMDLIVEVRVREEAALVKEASALEGMDSVSLLSHDGETTY